MATSSIPDRVKKALEKLPPKSGLIVSNFININYLLCSPQCLSKRETYLFLSLNNTALFTTPLANPIKTPLKIKQVRLTPDINAYEQIAKHPYLLNIKNIFLETCDLTVHEFDNILKYIPHKKAIKSSFLILNLRKYKDKTEIQKIKKACDIASRAIITAKNLIKSGITEIELAQKIRDYYIYNNSHESFPTIVAFGKNSANPHHKPSNKPLKENSPILIDTGAIYNSYFSDITRMFLFKPKNNELPNIYQKLLLTQKQAINSINTQISFADLDRKVKKKLKSQGFPVFPHGLGHGTGLEIHELPRINSKTSDYPENNQVFTVEPAFYISGKYGMRIEDLLYFNNTAFLLTDCPKNLGFTHI